MKKVSKKLRLLLIDKFFERTNELPHEISFSHNEVDWKIFNLKSANFIHEVGHKNIFGDQLCIWS